MSEKTPPGKWSTNMFGMLFGITGSALARYLHGQSYPTLQTLQKFEAVLGWPVSEQVQLIPPHWDWPIQNGGPGAGRGEPTDYRYGMKLRQVLQEWGDANPRTVLSNEVRQHPAIPSRAGTPRGEFKARARPLAKKR
jgi:transcriptional regulator with XRE-family HTH domain